MQRPLLTPMVRLAAKSMLRFTSLTKARYCPAYWLQVAARLSKMALLMSITPSDCLLMKSEITPTRMTPAPKASPRT